MGEGVGVGGPFCDGLIAGWLLWFGLSNFVLPELLLNACPFGIPHYNQSCGCYFVASITIGSVSLSTNQLAITLDAVAVLNKFTTTPSNPAFSLLHTSLVSGRVSGPQGFERQPEHMRLLPAPVQPGAGARQGRHQEHQRLADLSRHHRHGEERGGVGRTWGRGKAMIVFEGCLSIC